MRKLPVLMRKLSEPRFPLDSPMSPSTKVEIPFLDARKRHGVNGSWTRFGDAFRDTRFSLWHANEQSRTNLKQHFTVPWSGHPRRFRRVRAQ